MNRYDLRRELRLQSHSLTPYPTEVHISYGRLGLNSDVHFSRTPNGLCHSVSVHFAAIFVARQTSAPIDMRNYTTAAPQQMFWVKSQRNEHWNEMKTVETKIRNERTMAARRQHIQ